MGIDTERKGRRTLREVDCLHCQQMVGGEKTRREEKEREEERHGGRVGEQDRTGQGERVNLRTAVQTATDF